MNKSKDFTPLEAGESQWAHKKSKPLTGFTIIELLVVVAVIALLASIVLISVNAIRAQSSDSKTKAQLSAMRAVASNYFDGQNPNNYGPDANSADCAAGTTGMAQDDVSGFKALVAPENYSDGISPTCTTDAAITANNEATKWSAYHTLKATTNIFCVDSTGAAKEEPSTWTAPVDGEPCP